jgi:hypothetical protein
LITPTDAVVLRKDLHDPFIDLVGSDKVTLPLKSKEFIPFLSMNRRVGYEDVPIFTFDDWYYITKHPKYGIINFDKVNYDWKSKKPIAFFRGGSTGCGWDAESNMRLKATQLSSMHPELIDAKITTVVKHTKIHKTRRVGRTDTKIFKEAPLVPQESYSNYKYLLQIDGNVAAYRLAKNMLFGSVILLVESDFSLWYQDKMKPLVHYVPIKSDLSNLVEMIEWCRLNDKKCKKIAENGRKFAEKVLTEKYLFKYLESVFKNA